MRSVLVGLGVLLLADPILATWGVVQQSQSSYVNGTSITAQFPTTVTSGDLLLVQINWNDATNTVTSVTDALGNTFTSAVGPARQSAGQSAQLFYAANANGGVDKISVTLSGAARIIVFVYEITGAATTNPLDVAATGSGSGTSVVTTSPITTTGLDEFVFAGVGSVARTDWAKPGVGFTGLQQNSYVLSEFQTVAPSGTTVNGTATLNISNTWAAFVAAFKSIPGSGGGGTASLVSIQLTPFSPTLSMGQTQQLTAIGTFSDGSTQDLTSSATWGSSNTSVATISSSGFATAAGHGTSSITATSGSITGSTPLTVEGALSSLQVTPANYSLMAGATQQFTATGNFNDGTTENVTGSVNWTSSNTGAATINASGLATAVASGSVNITATSGAVTGSTNLTATQPAGGVPLVAQTPLVQTNSQWFTQYYTQNPPGAGESACSASCIAQTFLNANTAGNLIFVWVSWSSGGFSLAGVSDSASNVYTHAPGYPITNPNGIVDDFWVAYNIAGSSGNKVTAKFGSGSGRSARMQITEYSGLAASNTLDVASNVSRNSTCTAPCTLSSAPSPTTTQSSEFVVATFEIVNCGSSCGSVLLTTGTGWVPEAGCSSCMGWGGQNFSGAVLIEQRAVSTIGSYTATSTDNTKSNPSYNVNLFTFKLAGGP